MAFTLSRIDRLTRTVPGNVDVALLPPRSAPTAATVWLSGVFADGVTSFLFAGPDADSTGAVVVPASADLWKRAVDSPEVDAEKVERITVLGGGAPLVAAAGVPVVSVNGKLGSAVVLSASDVGAPTTSDLSDGLAAKVNSSTYTTGLAAKQDVATLGATVAADATVKAAFERPNLSTAVIWGDSYTSRNFVAGTDAYNSLQGYWTWATTLSRHRVRLLKNAGVHGEGTAAILARFTADVAAYSPGWVVIQGGTNDVAGGTDAATIIANLTAMLDKVRTIGARAILFTIPPRNALTSGQRAVQVQVNRWVRDQGRTRAGVYIIDAWQSLVDPATWGLLASVQNGDGIHVNGVGGARLGRLVAGLINQQAPAVDLLGHSTEDPLLLSTNPHLTGTGGTLGTGITGSVAAGWTTGAITSVTAAASKVARTDQLPGEWQQFAVTAGTGLTLSQNQNGVNTQWTPGTTQVFAACEFETDSDFAITSSSGAFTLSVLSFNSSFASQGSVADFAWVGGDTWAAEARPQSGVMRTPVFTVPVGANLRLVTQITFKGAGTFRIGRIALYKLA